MLETEERQTSPRRFKLREATTDPVKAGRALPAGCQRASKPSVHAPSELAHCRLGLLRRHFGLRSYHLDRLHIAMIAETGTSRNKVSHDHVFLEPAQVIDLSESSRFREYPGGILERGSRNEAVGLQRRLSNTQQNRDGFRR